MSGYVTLNEALHCFDHMLSLQPTPPMSSFNYLLGALSKNKHYSSVISLCQRMNLTGLLPDFITLNILLNCFCNLNRVCDGFVVLGSILRRGCSPDTVTYTSLIKGLCKEDRIGDAVGLFKKMVKVGCMPNVITYGTLINGLCRTGNTGVALKLHVEMLNGQFGANCKPNAVCYGTIIDGLCK